MPIRCAIQTIGEIKEEIKRALNINFNITVAVGCHDQVGALIGSGVFKPTQAMNGTGTVECMPVLLEEVPQNKDFYNCGYSLVPYIGNKFACYALSFTDGATLKWFRDNFAEAEKAKSEAENKSFYSEFDKQLSAKPTEILIMPHFSGAATPYMDSESRAAVVGLTLGTTKTDIYKALMEGTSYEMKLNFNTITATISL